jgi:hypothetical protein
MGASLKPDTKSKNNSSILLALLTLILMGFLALTFLAQNNLLKELDKSTVEINNLTLVNEDLQKDIDSMLEYAVVKVGFQGQRPGEDLEELLAATNTVSNLYREVFSMQTINDQAVNYDQLAVFMTEQAIAQAKEPTRTFDALTCGQSERRYFNVHRPVISENKGTVEVTAAYVDSQATVKLDLVKQNGKWLINNSSCPETYQAN